MQDRKGEEVESEDTGREIETREVHRDRKPAMLRTGRRGCWGAGAGAGGWR